MANRTDSEKKFDRFFIIIVIIAVLTALLTYSTTWIENQQAKQEQQDSLPAQQDKHATQ